MKPGAELDYEKLRAILERQLGKKVSLEYATGAGNFLISVYETLLYEEDETDDKLSTDTTQG